MWPLKVLVLSGAACVLLMAPARAELVTLSYSGTITGAHDGGVISGAGSYVGQAITGSYVLDTSLISGASSFDPPLGGSFTFVGGITPNWLQANVNVAGRGLSTGFVASTD